MLSDEAAERDARHRGARNARAIENGRELDRQVGNAIVRSRHRAFAVAGEIKGEQRAFALHSGERHRPQPMVDAEAMQKNERRSIACPMQRDSARIERCCIFAQGFLHVTAFLTIALRRDRRIETNATLLNEAGGMQFDVDDTGIGIPPDQIDRVMGPFYQVDGSLARTQEGTGLGLPIARSLASCTAAPCGLRAPSATAPRRA